MPLTRPFVGASLLVASLVILGCSSGGGSDAREPSGATKNAIMQTDPGTALVTTTSIRLFESPSKSSDALRMLGPHTAVTSLGEVRDAFLHVDVSGDHGWVLSQFLAPSSSDDDSSGGGGAGSGSGSELADDSSDITDVCVSTINDFRAQNGLPPLTRWRKQEDCASNEASTDAANNSPHGAFLSCNETAQNECPGMPGQPEDALVPCLQQMMDEGPGGGHYENIMSQDFTMVACGITMVDGDMWSVQNFR
jgi:hypothetical protein